MALCPIACVDTPLIATAGNCNPQPTKRGIDRAGFFLCNTDLPSPLTCAALEALVEAGSLVFSNPLANVNKQDPETEEILMSDCQPAIESVVQRIIEFQDRNSVAVAADPSTSPATEADPFQHYKFWKDKVNKTFALRVLFTHCDGSVVIPREANGDYMRTTVRAFVADERTTGASPFTLQYIKGTFTFKGDPFDLGNPPEVDADGNVFDISQCEIF